MTQRPSTVHGRIKLLAANQQLTLTQLAATAGYSVGHVSKVLSGKAPLNSREAITRFATALGVSPHELVGIHLADQTDPALLEVQATIAPLRLALVGSYLGHATTEARAVAAIAVDVERIVHLRSQVQLAEMGRLLPGVITELYSATAGSEDPQEVLRLLVRALVSAMTIAHVLGNPDLAYMITTRGIEAAVELDDPGWVSIAEVSACHAMLPMGGATQAYALASRAVDRAGRTAGTAFQLAGHGALLTVSSLMAPLADHAGEVQDRLAEAEAIARRVGEQGPDLAYFGPTNVSLYRMAVALEAGEPDRAAAVAAAVDPDRIVSPERRAKYFFDAGRALAELPGREDEAIGALVRSEALSPLRFRTSIAAADVLPRLLARVRPASAAGLQVRHLVHRSGLGTLV